MSEIIKIFEPFPKIPRFEKAGGCVITEKIDGTNAQICIRPEKEVNIDGSPMYSAHVGDLYIYAGSRSRLITPEDDNYCFAMWVRGNAKELIKLGPGRHYGEWWGEGIQRNYGLREKRFSLFNVQRWTKPDVDLPNCVSVVPVLYRGVFEVAQINATLMKLGETGSIASPGYMNPEGIVIYQYGSDMLFKKTFKDEHKYEQDIQAQRAA